MAIAYPIVPKVLNAFSSKSLLLVDLTLQFLLSWVCARAANTEVLVTFSFVIGFLKGFLMLWLIRRIKSIFSPRDVRSEFYAYFYPLVFSGGQLSMVVTALLAYHYDWKYMYYFMMMLLIVAILLVIILLRHDRPSTGVPLRELHVREMVIISAGLLMLIYVITYGRISDWMASTKICVYIVIAPLLIALFLWEQFHSPQPFVSLKPLFQWKAILGYFYMMLVMFFTTSTTLLSNYMTAILRVDNVHNYTLYIYLLPGYVLGAFVCFWWFRWQRWRFRFLIAGGMACFAVFFGMLYFTISPDSTYEMLFLRCSSRGLGMMVLLIAFGLFRRRGPQAEVAHLKRLLPHRLPFRARPRRRLGLLQQHALPTATALHRTTLGKHDRGRPPGGRTLFLGPGQQPRRRARHRRSHEPGHEQPLHRRPAAKHAPRPEAHAGLAAGRDARPRRHLALRPLP